ncbi:Rieske 2Fe-2S domain-containing protein [Pseudomonas lopnurensis]|uniref:Rieske 2Fe-2S domain-containing protein n=1 Tax=Pseudomonas lopnurensis TaxID=1477517 RepID=UPI0028B02BBA|nr:Rieske 2Fe-2S domain-containing protein [Pseudomonas lopnurensis]
MTTGNWWASALSEAVNNKKPLAVACDGEELALFRDASGRARALEDRCPHRRVPLSLGCVVQGGLQCGYHGWTFDGESGACSDIPNLHGNERVPPRHSARAYPTREADGFVHVWLGEGEPQGTLPSTGYQPVGREYSGSAIASVPHDEYLAVMLDGPDCLLEFAHVRMTDFFLGDPREEEGCLVLDRGAVWSTQVLPSQFVIDYPLMVRTAVPLRGGMIRVQLLDQEEIPLISLLIGTGGNRRGTTSLCWRGFRHAHQPAKVPLRWRAARRAGCPPFTVKTDIEGAALARLLVAPSRDLRQLRRPSLIPVREAV